MFEKILGAKRLKKILTLTVTLWTCWLLAPAIQAQSAIHLKARASHSDRDPLGRERGGANGGGKGAPQALPRHFMLEFGSYPGPEIRRELARRGIRTLQYLPDNGLMVSSEAAPNLAGLNLVSAGALDPEDKLSPLLAAQQVSGYVVVFQLDSDMGKAREMVRGSALEILENPALLAWQLLVTGAYQDVAALAQNDLVAYVLPASPDLLAGAPLIGCAGALTEAGTIGEYVVVGNGWAKDADGGVSLNYFFESLTDKLDESTVRSEIERAFREWARYTNLTLSPAQRSGLTRSIDIQFARGAHGDPYPFDGPGGVLAHTFYPSPPNAEPLAGDMHLDADENWHAGGGNVDLFTVALHEAGHALGLGHSDRPGAVMYPYYRLASGLTDDDIAGIRDLYGNNSSVPAPPPVPPAPAPGPTPAPPSPPTPAPAPAPTPAPKPTPTPTPTQPPAPTPTPAPPSNPGADTTPPSLNIASPGSTVVSTSAASVTISGTASDNVAVTSVKWGTSFGDAGAASGTAHWSANVPLLIGNNTVTLMAYDAAGNSSWRAITVVRR